MDTRPESTAPTRAGTRLAVFLGALFVGALVLAACSSTANYELLSLFFDGVPDPNAKKPEPSTPKLPVVGAPNPVKPGQVIYAHRPYAETKCAKCHASRIGKPDDIGSIFQGVPLLREPLNRLCFMCHKIEKKKYLHAPAVSGQCVFCHDPHQTPYKKMLLMKSTRDLCARCHRGSTFLTEAAHADYGKRECTECHDPHSADFEFNLLPGVRAGKPEPRKPTVSLPKEW